MLFLASFAIAADLTTYDPASWVTWGLAPSTARELADPVTTPKVGPSGMLNIGFGSEDVGGGGLYRGGTTRVFVGVAPEGSASTTREQASADHVASDYVDVPLQLVLVQRMADWGLALQVTGEAGYITAESDGNDVFPAGNGTVGDVSVEGGVTAGEMDARLLVQWGPQTGELRPRLGAAVVGSIATRDIDLVERQGDTEELWSGDPSPWFHSEVALPGGANAWTAGGGVRAGLDFGGTAADPRTRAWTQVDAVGGGPVELDSYYSYANPEGADDDIFWVDHYSVEDATSWDVDVEVGLVRKLGGDGAALWIGGVVAVGFGGDRYTNTVSIESYDVEGEDRPYTDREKVEFGSRTGALRLQAAGSVDLGPGFRVWAGIQPEIEGTLTTNEQLSSSSYVDTDWNGRLAMEWHHPKGFVAAIAMGWSPSNSVSTSSIASLFGSNTSLWIGWVPE